MRGDRSQYVKGSEPERFWPKVEVGDCWRWLGAINDAGYGIFRTSDRRNVRAHRWCYEALVGPIPEGLTLDHLCRNPACINPDHLEPVTQKVNKGRSVAGRRNWRKLRTHCKRGHAFGGYNDYIYKGQRHCRACRVEDNQRARARRKSSD